MNNKIKISQQEINDIYEISKDEPFPKVKEVTIYDKQDKIIMDKYGVKEEEEEEEESFLTEEETKHDKLLFDILEEPQEDKGEVNA